MYGNILLIIVIINNMDYSIDRLDECVFDYLVANMDAPKSLYEIYDAITSETGLRCPELYGNLLTIPTCEQLRFFTVCYTLDTNYKYIYKFIKNNTVYLMYSCDFSDDKNYDYNIAPAPTIFQLNTFYCGGFTNNEGWMAYIMNIMNNGPPIMYNGSLMEHCIKTNNLDLLDKLTEKYGVYNSDDYCKMLKLALHKSDYPMTNKIINLQLKFNYVDRPEFDEFEKKVLVMYNSLHSETDSILNLYVSQSETMTELQTDIMRFKQDKLQLSKEITTLKQLHKNAKSNLMWVGVVCICIGLTQLFGIFL
jgi:hypothetical protein